MVWHVPLADMDYGEDEEQAVLDVLRSKWLTMGEVTQTFEAEFCRMTGSKHTISVANGTLALHLACLAVGVGPGDEVIVPSLSFVATSNAVLYCGASARFAEVVGAEDLTIDPQSIETLITPKTKAIIVMHYAGFPCRMREILEISNKHGIPVIEDAAHAPGAALEDKALGTWGDIGCFSFFSNKNLSTGEGGVLTCNRDDLATNLRLLRSHGMTTLTYDRHKGHAFSYDVIALGYNYRIDEIHSALGIQQLRKLERNNARRREITHTYWKALKSTGIGLPFEAARVGQPSHHIFPVLLPPHVDRHIFMSSLRDAGIQSSIHYRPIHTFSYYRDKFGAVSLPLTEDIGRREVTLPLFPTMTDEQLELVIENVKTLVV